MNNSPALLAFFCLRFFKERSGESCVPFGSNDQNAIFMSFHLDVGFGVAGEVLKERRNEMELDLVTFGRGLSEKAEGSRDNGSNF